MGGDKTVICLVKRMCAFDGGGTLCIPILQAPQFYNWFTVPNQVIYEFNRLPGCLSPGPHKDHHWCLARSLIKCPVPNKEQHFQVLLPRDMFSAVTTHEIL